MNKSVPPNACDCSARPDRSGRRARDPSRSVGHRARGGSIRATAESNGSDGHPEQRRLLAGGPADEVPDRERKAPTMSATGRAERDPRPSIERAQAAERTVDPEEASDKLGARRDDQDIDPELAERLDAGREDPHNRAPVLERDALRGACEDENSRAVVPKDPEPATLPVFSLAERKRRKKKRAPPPPPSCPNESADDRREKEQRPPVPERAGAAKGGSDDECLYPYEVLLRRLYDQVRSERAPPSTKDRPRLNPPLVMRAGGVHTVWSNFSENCAALGRPVEHVLSYVLTELGTTGSIGADGRLTVRGSGFKTAQFGSLLRKYREEYVLCPVCKGRNTVLEKEKRLLYIRCENCSSRNSVTRIRAAFVAETKASRKKQKETNK